MLMAVATAYKFVLAVVGMMILLFWQKLLKEHLGGYFFWYIVGLSLNVLLVILLLFVMLRPVLIRHLAEKIIVMAQKCGMKIPKEKWLEKLDGFLDGYRGTVLFFRDHKEKILILIVMTFVQRSSAFLLTFLVYLGFGLSGTADVPDPAASGSHLCCGGYASGTGSTRESRRRCMERYFYRYFQDSIWFLQCA